MSSNEAHFSVIGFVATQPRGGYTKSGTRSVSMRVGWTPRTFDRETKQWTDQQSSFVTVQCYNRVAENAYVCLRRGEPIVVRGTLRVREYEHNGVRRSSVEVVADSIGHDLSRGISVYRKASAQVEQTAYEHEQATGEAGRRPLLGDLGATGSGVEHEEGDRPEADDAELPDMADVADEESDDERDPELGASEAFDDAVREMIAAADDAPAKLGA
jgi:single-strand DNA-binding protein